MDSILDQFIRLNDTLEEIRDALRNIKNKLGDKPAKPAKPA